MVSLEKLQAPEVFFYSATKTYSIPPSNARFRLHLLLLSNSKIGRKQVGSIWNVRLMVFYLYEKEIIITQLEFVSFITLLGKIPVSTFVSACTKNIKINSLFIARMTFNKEKYLLIVLWNIYECVVHLFWHHNKL